MSSPLASQLPEATATSVMAETSGLASGPVPPDSLPVGGSPVEDDDFAPLQTGEERLVTQSKAITGLRDQLEKQIAHAKSLGISLDVSGLTKVTKAPNLRKKKAARKAAAKSGPSERAAAPPRPKTLASAMFGEEDAAVASLTGLSERKIRMARGKVGSMMPGISYAGGKTGARPRNARVAREAGRLSAMEAAARSQSSSAPSPALPPASSSEPTAPVSPAAWPKWTDAALGPSATIFTVADLKSVALPSDFGVPTVTGPPVGVPWACAVAETGSAAAPSGSSGVPTGKGVHVTPGVWTTTAPQSSLHEASGGAMRSNAPGNDVKGDSVSVRPPSSSAAKTSRCHIVVPHFQSADPRVWPSADWVTFSPVSVLRDIDFILQHVAPGRFPGGRKELVDMLRVFAAQQWWVVLDMRTAAGNPNATQKRGVHWCSSSPWKRFVAEAGQPTLGVGSPMPKKSYMVLVQHDLKAPIPDALETVRPSVELVVVPHWNDLARTLSERSISLNHVAWVAFAPGRYLPTGDVCRTFMETYVPSGFPNEHEFLRVMSDFHERRWWAVLDRRVKTGRPTDFCRFCEASPYRGGSELPLALDAPVTITPATKVPAPVPPAAIRRRIRASGLPPTSAPTSTPVAVVGSSSSSLLNSSSIPVATSSTASVTSPLS